MSNLPDSFPYTPGDLIYFEAPGVKFTWQTPSRLAPGMSKYDVLYVAEIITDVENFQHQLPVGSFIVDGLVFPAGYTTYPAGNDPLNEKDFTETIEINNIQVNDIVLFKGERISIVLNLEPEPFEGFDFWREQANMENEDLGILLTKGEPYVLKRLPQRN